MKKYKKLLSTYNEVVKAKKEENKESDYQNVEFTLEETTLLKEKMSLLYDMTKWVKRHNEIDEFEPDWGDYSQYKHGLFLRKKKIEEFWDKKENFFIFGLTVSSKERAKQMLQEFGSRIEKYY